MIRFDWHAFCATYNVAFVTSGPNTARGHISIRCPYCGEADRSQHMGLSLDPADPVWGCFRNSAHRGRNPRRLVQKLLGLSFDEAQRLVGTQAPPTDDGSMEAAIQRLGAVEEEREEPDAALAFPAEFKAVVPGRGYADRFIAYLEGRGFLGAAGEVCDRYGLHYALTGDFAWRLIFPIHDVDGRPIGWTGRDIRPSAWLRYRTSTPLPNRVLYNAHLAVRNTGGMLVVVEGPVDALKVDYYGRALGVTSVATLGTALPRERRAALASLAQRFKRTALLFDDDTLSEATGLVAEVSETMGGEVELWRSGAKDPGGMPPEEIKGFLNSRINREGL